MPALDLKGCLEDSPKFRRRVNAHEETIQHFESSLKVLLKLSRSQVNLYEGRKHNQWRRQLEMSNASCYAEYSLRQQELALGFVSFGQSQDDPIVGKDVEHLLLAQYISYANGYSLCTWKVWKVITRSGKVSKHVCMWSNNLADQWLIGWHRMHMSRLLLLNRWRSSWRRLLHLSR